MLAELGLLSGGQASVRVEVDSTQLEVEVGRGPQTLRPALAGQVPEAPPAGLPVPASGLVLALA